jgi:photosystem II stability/assembly factor-like uncharacterized protein
VGSRKWHTISSSFYASDSVQLVTQGSQNIYVAFLGSIDSGVIGGEYATFWNSHDGGSTWTIHQDPCSRGGRQDSGAITIAAAPGPSLYVLCAQVVGQSQFLMESINSGSFLSRTAFHGEWLSSIAATSSSKVFVASNDYVLASDDGGSSFVKKATVPKQNISGPVWSSDLGFQSSEDGHWTGYDFDFKTTDGGSTWINANIAAPTP